jgi:hypothetical protein
MDDTDLAVLQLAHRASGKLLKGREVTPLEELSLHAVVKMIEPILSPLEKKRTRDMLLGISRTRRTPTIPAACLAGSFFFQ